MNRLRLPWKKVLARTRQDFLERVTGLFRGRSKADKELFDGLEELLIGADVGAEPAQQLVDSVRSEISGREAASPTDVLEVLKKKISETLAAPAGPDHDLRTAPHVVMVVGVNGAGKTTFIGKLAHHYKNQGKKVLLAAADTFRAAAGEQLDVWAKRTGADVVGQPHGSDPAAVAFDALDAAMARKVDVLIVDTAGRLHTKTNLMEELKKIRRILSKKMPGAPHEVLLVLDAVCGQNGLIQAREFREAGGLTGIVLAKLDGTARGGIVLAIRRHFGVPVLWIGTGEGMDDLLPFDPEAFAEALVGGGEHDKTG
jgi:fused signal recognition particle receptor